MARSFRLEDSDEDEVNTTLNPARPVRGARMTGGAGSSRPSSSRVSPAIKDATRRRPDPIATPSRIRRFNSDESEDPLLLRSSVDSRRSWAAATDESEDPLMFSPAVIPANQTSDSDSSVSSNRRRKVAEVSIPLMDLPLLATYYHSPRVKPPKTASRRRVLAAQNEEILTSAKRRRTVPGRWAKAGVSHTIPPLPVSDDDYVSEEPAAGGDSDVEMFSVSDDQPSRRMTRQLVRSGRDDDRTPTRRDIRSSRKITPDQRHDEGPRRSNGLNERSASLALSSHSGSSASYRPYNRGGRYDDVSSYESTPLPEEFSTKDVLERHRQVGIRCWRTEADARPAKSVADCRQIFCSPRP